MSDLWVVVLAGGVGSRFWPVSTPSHPKQMLPLVSDQPLLVDTLQRVAPLAPSARTLVLTNASLRDAVAAAAPDLPSGHILVEPKPAGTAAALAWAAHEVRRMGGERAVMVCVHADWAVADTEGFRTALQTAAEAAEAYDALATVGIVPSRPDIGYGYIRPGQFVAGRIRRVAQFVEKPDRTTAERFVAEGYLWNSGIFAWSARRFLAELEAHSPEVWPALRACDGDAAQFFAAVQSIAVDIGVLERSERVLVLSADFGWDDVGTWAAVHRVRQRDARGNAVHGQAYLVQAKDNVVHADGRTVVLYGVENLVVVTAPGITMVTTRDKAADLKTMLAQLPARVAERP
jgi:mannose-1-phosphate guanylyltransferase